MLSLIIEIRDLPKWGSVGYESVTPRHRPVRVLLPRHIKRRLARERRRKFEYILNDVGGGVTRSIDLLEDERNENENENENHATIVRSSSIPASPDAFAADTRSDSETSGARGRSRGGWCPRTSGRRRVGRTPKI